jgi:hypothetical protein
LISLAEKRAREAEDARIEALRSSDRKVREKLREMTDEIRTTRQIEEALPATLGGWKMPKFLGVEARVVRWKSQLMPILKIGQA